MSKTDKKNKIQRYVANIIKLKRQEKRERNFNERRKIILKLKKNLEKALEIEPDNISFQIDLMYVYINLKKLEKARRIGDDFIGQTDAKEYLNALALIEEKTGNYGKAIEYVEKMIEKDPNNRALRNRIEILECKKENRPFSQDMIKKYATEEEREKFIAQVQKDFIFGKIGKKEIKEKLEEAKKYINFYKSLIALSDIEAKITEDKKGKIKMLEKYINDKNSITPEEYETIQNEIAKTRIEIEQDELIESYIDEKNKKEAQKKKQDAEEQRKYSKEIIAKMKKGNITKEELPEIIRKLETFMDSTKSIFLITKLYEALYNRDRAYKELIKYTNISSLTPGEKRKIVEMQKTLTDSHKETKKMKRIKGAYKKKEEKKQKYQKKIQSEEIKKLLREGKTVKEIFNIMKDKDSGIAIKTINRIKGHYLKRNEKLAQEQLIIKEDALALLKGGYTPDEVYEIIGYDIPISNLKEMNRKWKKEEIQL